MAPLSFKQILCCLALVWMILQVFVMPVEALTISADQQLEFADHLYQNGQFRRAAEEYQRFAFFFADDTRQLSVLYKIGEAFFQDQDMAAALQAFKNLANKTPLLPESIKAHFMITECYLKMGDPNQALVQLHNLITLSDSADVRDRAYFRMGWIHIELTDWVAAKRAFTRISPESPLPVDQIIRALDNHGNIPSKNPALAGTLSILPGAGQLYCGRYQDALAAFIVNVGLIWAAVDAFDREQYALGGLLSFLGAGFYTGNIYSAVSSAHKYNESQKRNFIEQIRSHLSLTIEQTPEAKAKGLVLSLNFHF